MNAHAGAAEDQRALEFALGDHRADAQADAVEHEVGVVVLRGAHAHVGNLPALRLQVRDHRFLQRKARKVRADEQLLVLDHFHTVNPPSYSSIPGYARRERFSESSIP